MKLSKKLNNHSLERFEAVLLKDIPRYNLKKGQKLKVIVTAFHDKSGYQVYTNHNDISLHISGSEEKILETIEFKEEVEC